MSDKGRPGCLVSETTHIQGLQFSERAGLQTVHCVQKKVSPPGGLGGGGHATAQLELWLIRLVAYTLVTLCPEKK